MASYKFLAGLIIGAVAGTAVALFLHSEKGKEIIDDVKNAAGDATDNLKSRIKSFNDELNDLLQRGKQFVEDLEKKASEASS